MGARLLCARLRMGVGAVSRKRTTRMNQGMGIANERLYALNIYCLPVNILFGELRSHSLYKHSFVTSIVLVYMGPFFCVSVGRYSNLDRWQHIYLTPKKTS